MGDSGAMTVLGYPSTVQVELEELLVLARATRRGLQTPFLVGDLPFGSYEVSDEQAITTALRFVKEAGCDAVKLEGGGATSVARARAIVGAGIPVMGHVGLTPQTSTALGGYKAQGRSASEATRIAREALALQEAGCFAIVFEAIPSAVSEAVMPLIEVPVIGIGAGPAVDGQVLVFHDLLGIREGLGARFVKRYASLLDEMAAGVAAFAHDVRDARIPPPSTATRSTRRSSSSSVPSSRPATARDENPLVARSAQGAGRFGPARRPRPGVAIRPVVTIAVPAVDRAPARLTTALPRALDGKPRESLRLP